MKTLKRLALGGAATRPTSPWILVHSMGKVGSYATYKAIDSTRRYNVLHTHQLNSDTIATFQDRQRQPSGHINQALRFIGHVRDEDEVKLVICIREPIARNVSAFFENLRFFGLQNATAHDVDFVAEQFVKRYQHRVPITWFADQVEVPFEIDLWGMGLNAYHTCKVGRLSIMILRAEDPDSQRQAALQQFLGCDDLRLQRMNIGNEKPYAALYDAFKQDFHAPGTMLNDLYESNYVKTFYSDDEINGFCSLWS